jgi:hypothetical protein
MTATNAKLCDRQGMHQLLVIRRLKQNLSVTLVCWNQFVIMKRLRIFLLFCICFVLYYQFRTSCIVHLYVQRWLHAKQLSREDILICVHINQ